LARQGYRADARAWQATITENARETTFFKDGMRHAVSFRITTITVAAICAVLACRLCAGVDNNHNDHDDDDDVTKTTMNTLSIGPTKGWHSKLL